MGIEDIKIGEESSGEYVHRNQNFNPSRPETEYLKLNSNFESLYSNYAEKAKKWPLYAFATSRIESGEKDQIDKVIDQLSKYISIGFSEKKGESSVSSKLDILKDLQKAESDNTKYSEAFVSFLRKTLDYFADLFLGLTPLKDLEGNS